MTKAPINDCNGNDIHEGDLLTYRWGEQGIAVRRDLDIDSELGRWAIDFGNGRMKEFRQACITVGTPGQAVLALAVVHEPRLIDLSEDVIDEALIGLVKQADPGFAWPDDVAMPSTSWEDCGALIDWVKHVSLSYSQMLQFEQPGHQIPEELKAGCWFAEVGVPGGLVVEGAGMTAQLAVCRAVLGKLAIDARPGHRELGGLDAWSCRLPNMTKPNEKRS